MSPSRVDENGNFPVDPTTIQEKNYTAEVSLEYAIVNLNNVQLSGQPDPIPIGVGSIATKLPLPPVTASIKMGSVPLIRIGTEPSADDLGTCSTQSKMAFHELVRLLNLKKTIDFPVYTAGCQQCDPQGPSPTTCPSNAALPGLESVKALIKTFPPSGEKQTVLGDIDNIEALISGKARTRGDQKDILMKLAEVQGYLRSVKPQDPLLGELDESVLIFSTPTRDCKTPLLRLTTQ